MYHKRILIFIVILFSCLIYCAPQEGEISEAKTNIVLINPSAWSLNSFLYLVQQKIVDIDDVRWRVVYDSKSSNRYAGGKKLLDDYPNLSFDLEIVDGELIREHIFQKNKFTDFFNTIFRNSDGMLFFGGADIPPASYGEKTKLLTGIDTPHRHLFELSLIFHLLGGYQNENRVPLLEEKPGYVVYGFCLGMQTLNVATGGTMIQDIPSEVYNLEYVEDILLLDQNQIHHNYWRDLYSDQGLSSYQFHQIRFIPGQFWTKDLQMKADDQPLVYSNHHQALEKIGKGFVVGATSLDGKIVESIHHNTYRNVLGVQFHPENYLLYKSDEKTYKNTPLDTVYQSNYEILDKNQSLEFHYAFWKYFSALFE